MLEEEDERVRRFTLMVCIYATELKDFCHESDRGDARKDEVQRRNYDEQKARKKRRDRQDEAKDLHPRRDEGDVLAVDYDIERS